MKEKKDRKEYFKEYVRTPEAKAAHAKVMRDLWRTPKGKSYAKLVATYPHNRFVRAKGVARRRKLEWTIEEADYLQLIAQPCYYCGRDTSKESGGGLDRKDNTLGYTLYNCIQCCGNCNRRRSRHMDSEEFKKQTELNKHKRGDRNGQT